MRVGGGVFRMKFSSHIRVSNFRYLHINLQTLSVIGEGLAMLE